MPRQHQMPGATCHSRPSSHSCFASGDKKLPFARLTIALAGKLPGGQPKYKEIVTVCAWIHSISADALQRLGGKVNTGSVGSRVTCLVATEDEVEKDTVRVQEAHQFNVPIVKPSFLTESNDKNEFGDAAYLCVMIYPDARCLPTISSRAPAPSSSPPTRGFASSVSMSLLTSAYAQKQSAYVPARSQSSAGFIPAEKKEKVKVVMQGRVPVDPASELDERAHVLEEGDVIWNASLSKVDLRAGTNSYYKMQV